MASNQRDFRKDKPTRRGSLCGAKPRQEPIRVRIVCGVKILTIYERAGK
jgi:hypothetical protein